MQPSGMDKNLVVIIRLQKPRTYTDYWKLETYKISSDLLSQKLSFYIIWLCYCLKTLQFSLKYARYKTLDHIIIALLRSSFEIMHAHQKMKVRLKSTKNKSIKLLAKMLKPLFIVVRVDIGY